MDCIVATIVTGETGFNDLVQGSNSDPTLLAMGFELTTFQSWTQSLKSQSHTLRMLTHLLCYSYFSQSKFRKGRTCISIHFNLFIQNKFWETRWITMLHKVGDLSPTCTWVYLFSLCHVEFLPQARDRVTAISKLPKVYNCVCVCGLAFHAGFNLSLSPMWPEKGSLPPMTLTRAIGCKLNGNAPDLDLL